MRKVKFIFTFLAVVFIFSACEFSPQEIQPVGDIKFENYPGTSGERPGPNDPPAPPDWWLKLICIILLINID